MYPIYECPGIGDVVVYSFNAGVHFTGYSLKPTPGSEFEIVFENVEKLSETIELGNIYELDETENVNSNLVNRPIIETEVMM